VTHELVRLWLWVCEVDHGFDGTEGEIGEARDGRRKSSRITAGQGGALVRGSAEEIVCPQARYR
jgi:hypothetical protein